ncbi:unnamed protein product [Rotaria sp. Silwood1]|nr:unnamed protein product [Rotaria sp. Silwood1]
MLHYRFIVKHKLIVRKMASLVNTLVDRARDSIANNINPAAVIPKSMISFVDDEKINLQQIANNFLARYFEFRTRDHEKKLNVVQLMSEYVGNFSTPICYLQFYLKRAEKFIQFAEELGPLSDREEIHRLSCIRIYKNFIQRYSELIEAIQAHESTCSGRLFRRSIERMKPEIAHVPINLHLQQLLVSSGDDPSQRSIYNMVTLGAPAVHHSRFTYGGLARIKAFERETNERLCYLQDKLQDVLILNSDINDALDHLTQTIASSSTNIQHSVLKLSFERVDRAVRRLFRRSIERMKPEIAHVPINLHLQQLLVSSGDDPSQRSIYNMVTLGAPAVHHSRFTYGGLARIKTFERETNERLCYLQDKLQDVLILNSDINDALDHLTQTIASSSTNMQHSVLKLSLERVDRAVVSLLEYSDKDLDTIANSSSQIIANPLIPRVSAQEVSASQDTIHAKAKKLLEEIKESMKKDEHTFGMAQLNNLKLIADELERHTCKYIMRYIFQESMEIERYSQDFRERFDIAFSQALTCLIFSISVLLSSVKISDQAWKLYMTSGKCIDMREKKSKR